MDKIIKHHEEEIVIPADAATVFAYADDHSRFSLHMSQSSWMTGGGGMDIRTDAGHGQKVGSHIVLKGKAFGIKTYFSMKGVREHFVQQS